MEEYSPAAPETSKQNNNISPLNLNLQSSPHLLRCAPTGGVSDGPGGLLPSFKLGFGLDLDEDRENVGVYDGLDLLPVTGCDVRNGPAGLYIQVNTSAKLFIIAYLLPD